jgi:hypothetical protein
LAERFPRRGFIWILIGLALFVANFVLETPLVLRGTELPFWPFVVGVGLIILIIDAVRARRRGDSDPPPA